MPYIPENEDEEFPYGHFSYNCPDKGKTVWFVFGPQISREPHLSGSHNQFLNKAQAEVVALWLNRAYQYGKTATRNEIKSALGLQ